MAETTELVQEGDMIQEHEQQILQEVQEPIEYAADGTVADAAQAEVVDPEPIDETNPIAVTSDTVVVIGGKKCVLRNDPESGQLVAYPFIHGRKYC